MAPLIILILQTRNLGCRDIIHPNSQLSSSGLRGPKSYTLFAMPVCRANQTAAGGLANLACSELLTGVTLLKGECQITIFRLGEVCLLSKSKLFQENVFVGRPCKNPLFTEVEVSFFLCTVVRISPFVGGICDTVNVRVLVEFASHTCSLCLIITNFRSLSG